MQDASLANSLGKTQDERVHKLVLDLVTGVKEDRWTPIISVLTDPEGRENWSSKGFINYTNNLISYIESVWGKDHNHPSATFLEAYGYFQRLPPRIFLETSASAPNDFPGRMFEGQRRHRIENTVEYILSQKAFDLLLPSPEKVSVFISYRRKISSLQALLLSHWLHRNNVEHFLDIQNADGGGKLLPHIEDAIKSRTHFLCLLGEIDKENTLQSTWVRQEIDLALIEGKTCVPFFQHDWNSPLLNDEEKAALDKLQTFKGVQTISTSDPSTIIQAYDRSLRDLLPYLNKSRV